LCFLKAQDQQIATWWWGFVVFTEVGPSQSVRVNG
jgi:hypothetical protein